MDPKVNIILTILTFLALSNCIIPNKTCNRIKVGEQWYEKDVMWTQLGRPYNLNVRKSTNTLFFSYSLTETYSDVDFQLAYFDMNTRSYEIIAGIKGGCTIAIDQENDEVYLGGSDGIYKYNMMTKIADVYGEEGTNIWSLFFKKNLFYISYPLQRLHIYIDGKFATVREFINFEVDIFYVTKKDEIYFANKTGLYKFNGSKMQAEVINELITVRQIAEDNEDRLYFCTNFGVYADVKYDGLKKIIDMKNVFGVTFDRENNMIYSDDNSIVMLKVSKVGCKDEPTW